MKEITVKPNDLNLKVYINGEPDLSQMDNSDFTLLATILEVTLSKHLENYKKRKGGKKQAEN